VSETLASREAFGAKPGADGDPAPELSAGLLLRQAREASGLHIAALAVALKVPVAKLEALEQDRMDLLPDAVFGRALAASVCRHLKVDPAPLLARLPRGDLPTLTLRDQRQQPRFNVTNSQAGKSAWARVSKPTALAGVALLLATLGVTFLPELKGSLLTVRESADRQASLPSPESAPLTLDLTSSTLPIQPIAGLSSGSAIPVTDAKTTSQQSISTAMSDADLRSSPALLAASGAIVSPGIVTMTASKESWVQISDAKGAVILRRLLGSGESVSASGALPMEVIVGRADSTMVEVRGKRVDLTPFARDNVAKFEVK
jgi:cytoskeleton protein RodZ